jgi:hypothetical protein
VSTNARFAVVRVAADLADCEGGEAGSAPLICRRPGWGALGPGVGHPPGSAMPLERAPLEHGHVEPAVVLGRKVWPGAVVDPLGPARRECPRAVHWGVGVALIMTQSVGPGVGIVYVSKVPATVCTVDPRAPPIDVDLALAERRRADRERAASPPGASLGSCRDERTGRWADRGSVPAAGT